MKIVENKMTAPHVTFAFCVGQYRRHLGILRSVLSRLKPECKFECILDYELLHPPSDPHVLETYVHHLERISHFREEYHRLQLQANRPEDNSHRLARELFAELSQKAAGMLAAIKSSQKKKTKKKNRKGGGRKGEKKKPTATATNMFSALSVDDELTEDMLPDEDDFSDALFLPADPSSNTAENDVDDGNGDGLEHFDRMLASERSACRKHLLELQDAAFHMGAHLSIFLSVYFCHDLYSRLPLHSLHTLDYLNVTYLCRSAQLYMVDLNDVKFLLVDQKYWMGPDALPQEEMWVLGAAVHELMRFMQIAYSHFTSFVQRINTVSPAPKSHDCLKAILSNFPYDRIPADCTSSDPVGLISNAMERFVEGPICPVCSIINYYRVNLPDPSLAIRCSDLKPLYDYPLAYAPLCDGGMEFSRLDRVLAKRLRHIKAILDRINENVQ